MFMKKCLKRCVNEKHKTTDGKIYSMKTFHVIKNLEKPLFNFITTLTGLVNLYPRTIRDFI